MENFPFMLNIVVYLLNLFMEKSQEQRLQSLDALRGFDMFWIIGGEGIFIGLASLTGWPLLNWWAHQLHHVAWHGFVFYDMIFPLFLFIAGISFPFSLAKSREKRVSNKDLYYKIIRRGLLLVLLGFVYNGILAFNFENFRYASVLGRIGLAWMFAALIFFNTKKAAPRIIWCIGFLIFYWLLAAFVPAPDYPGTDRFSAEGNFSCYFDRLFLPGRLYGKIFDPEGILGIIPAISTALLGMLTGQFVMQKKENLGDKKKTLYLIIAGIILIIVGLLWNTIFPINKALWSSSFVCFVGGLSLLLFSLFYYIIDVLKYRKWSFFFVVIGLNSITIYLAQRIIDFYATSNFLFGGLIGWFPESWNEFLNSTAYIVIGWGFLYFLYRQRIFLKV